MKKILPFILLLVSCFISKATDPALRALEIRQVLDKTEYMPEDIALIRDCVSTDDNFAPALEDMTAGRPISLESYFLSYEGLVNILEKARIFDDDNYRFALLKSMEGGWNALDYDIFFKRLGQFDDNIEHYVKDEDLRMQWTLLKEGKITDDMRLNDVWNSNDLVFAIIEYLKNRKIDTELKYHLAFQVLESISNGIGYIEDFDRWVAEMRQTLAIIRPGCQASSDDLKYLETAAAYALNPMALSRLVELERMDAKFANRPTELISLWLHLSTIYSFSEKQARAIDMALKAKCLSDSLVNGCKLQVNPYQAVATASAVVLGMAYLSEKDTTRMRDTYSPILMPDYTDGATLLTTIRKQRLLIYNLLQSAGLYDSGDLIASYIRGLDYETNVPALSIGQAWAGFYKNNHGVETEGESLIALAKQTIANHPMEQSIIAQINELEGLYYFSINKPELAEGIYNSAIEYYNLYDRYFEISNILSVLTKAFWRVGDQEKAILYADDYWDVRQKTFVPLYRCFQDFEIQLILACANPDAEKKIKALQRLSKLCEEYNNFVVLSYCCQIIAENYAMNPQLKDATAKAYEYYETAFSLAAGNSDSPAFFQDLINIVNSYSAFLDRSGDLKRRSELSMAVIDEVEKSGQELGYVYVNFLSTSLIASINNNNLFDIFFFSTKLKNIVSIYLNDKGVEGYARAVLLGMVMPPLSSVMAWYIDTAGVENAKQMLGFGEDELLSYLDQTINDYSSQVSDSDWNFTNLHNAKIRLLIASKRYEEASSELDNLSQNPYYGGQTEMADFMPFFRLTIAQGRNDYEEVSRLLSLPGIDDLLNSENYCYNLSTMTNLFLRIEDVSSRNGDFAKAMDYARRRHSIVRDFIEKQYAALSEGERASLFAAGTTSANDILSYLPRVDTSDNRKLAFDASMYFRNLLLESSNAQRRAIYATKDSALIADYEKYSFLRHDAAKNNTDISQVARENLFASIRQMEADIASRCDGFNSLMIRRNTSWRDVAKKLRKDEVAIEFIRSFDIDCKENIYGALIVTRGCSAPEYVGLMRESELIRAMEPMKTSTRLENGVNRVYRYINNGKILYNQLWKPIEEYLEGVSTVYYAPTGLLSTVAFAAIEDSTRTPISSRFNLKMLSSTSQIVSTSKKGKEKPSGTMTIFGAVKYDADLSKAEERGGEWANLPESAVEISYVDSLCHSNGRISSVVYSGENASEHNFRNLSGSSPDMLLMSTHGFYQDSRTASLGKYYLNKKISSDSLPNLQIDPLLRGGIILYDANAVWNDEEERPDETDGVLTAMEISGIDLSNTRLAILSACETGLGEDIGSEGISGLQRGFKLAGVESLVMSLWKVNDAAGSLFMRRFHDLLINSSMERHDAFRATQLELREKYPSSPFLWAPFIMLD